jgi:hypothetical protein
MNEQELINDGYVMTSPPDLRCQLWEKHGGTTGSRSLVDQVLRDSETGDIRESGKGLENIEVADLERFSDNLDLIEIINAAGANPATKTRLVGNRKVGGALKKKKASSRNNL